MDEFTTSGGTGAACEVVVWDMAKRGGHFWEAGRLLSGGTPYLRCLARPHGHKHLDALEQPGWRLPLLARVQTGQRFAQNSGSSLIPGRTQMGAVTRRMPADLPKPTDEVAMRVRATAAGTGPKRAQGLLRSRSASTRLD
jgi:hypothetical protein